MPRLGNHQTQNAPLPPKGSLASPNLVEAAFLLRATDGHAKQGVLGAGRGAQSGKPFASVVTWNPNGGNPRKELTPQILVL